MTAFSPSAQGQWLTRLWVFAAAGSALAVLALIDGSTGPHVHLGPLYLLPLAFAAWFGGRWAGYGVAIETMLAWLLISKFDVGNLPPGSGAMLLNLSVRIVYYPMVIEALVMKRGMERRLNQLVEQRTGELRQQVAERERAEAAVHKLAAELSAAEDAQRRRLAYDIHDALSQMLGVVKMNLEAAAAEAVPGTRQHERLVDLVHVSNDLIRQTRELTFDLHPPMLDDLGLVPALRGLAEEFRRRTSADVTITEAGEPPPRRLPAPLSGYLFRSIKELVNNAIKHGRAAEVVVGIHWLQGGRQLRVVVDDDGAGFDPAVALTPHVGRGLGLAGISERVGSLGGMLKLDSNPGQGARVILETPLPREVLEPPKPAPVVAA